jgi:hypothetical protein
MNLFIKKAFFHPRNIFQGFYDIFQYQIFDFYFWKFYSNEF